MIQFMAWCVHCKKTTVMREDDHVTDGGTITVMTTCTSCNKTVRERSA